MEEYVRRAAPIGDECAKRLGSKPGEGGRESGAPGGDVKMIIPALRAVGKGRLSSSKKLRDRHKFGHSLAIAKRVGHDNVCRVV